jgi:hypothetical protein
MLEDGNFGATDPAQVGKVPTQTVIEPQASGEPAQAPAEQPEGTQAQPKPIEINGRTFKSTEELIEVYKQSSAEGVRLNAVRKSIQAELDATKAQVAELELKSGLPTFTEKTEEELSLMEPAEKAVYLIEKKQFDKDLAKFKTDREKMLADNKAKQESNQREITEIVKKMTEDTKTYPHFKELEPIMDNILDKTPWLSGRHESPEIVYYLARGIKADQEDRKSGQLTTKSQEQAKTAAAAAGAVSTGATIRQGDGTAGKPAPGSNEEFNQRLINAGKNNSKSF